MEDGDDNPTIIRYTTEVVAGADHSTNRFQVFSSLKLSSRSVEVSELMDHTFDHSDKA